MAIRGALLVCEPVLVEVLFLLRRSHTMQARVLQMVELGGLRISFSIETEVAPVRRLMAKYADVPMSRADACLVRMSELYDTHPVCTLDADFHVYRRHGRQPIPLIIPPTL